jgi:excisionase family DNA binding protein
MSISRSGGPGHAAREAAGATRTDSGATRRRGPHPRSAAPGANGALLFAGDVAALVGMTRDWIYAETRAGRIPHLVLGRYYRYRRESIDAWLLDKERGVRAGAAQAPRRR